MDQSKYNVGICLGNSHGNFQLCRFTTSENIAKRFRGGYFLTHTVGGKGPIFRHINWRH